METSYVSLEVLLHNKKDPGPPWAGTKVAPVPLPGQTQPHASSTSPVEKSFGFALLTTVPWSQGRARPRIRFGFFKGRFVQASSKY